MATTSVRRKVWTASTRSRLAITVVASAGALVMILPVVWMVLSSFKPQTEILAIPIQFWPRHWTLQGFQAVWQQSEIPRAYLNSLVISAASVASVLFTSSLGGYVFARTSFVGRRVVFYFVLSTTMVPFITLLIPLYVLMTRAHLTNSYVGVWLPFAVSSLGIFLCRQFTYSIPRDLYDAAKIDGANEWTIYLRIVLPLLKPALAVLAIFSFLSSFNNYLWPLVVLNNQNLFTLPLVLANIYNGLGVPNFQVIMAASLVASIPTVAVFLIFQRYIVRGISLTGIKL